MELSFQHISLDELTTWLQDLLRINTVSHNRNEIEAANYIKKIFEKEGLKPEIYSLEKERANLFLRIPGRRGKPKLMLSAHLDVVPAEDDTWDHPPFSGKIVDGEIWGRGAIDCKGLVAMMIGVVVELTRSKAQLEDDLLVLFLADEEVHGVYGAKYMVENHPDIVNVPFVIQEGGGMVIKLNDQWYGLLNNAEKGSFVGKLTFEGIPGHGSIPKMAVNPIEKMAKAIQLLAKHETEIIISKDVKQQLIEMGGGKLASLLFSNKYTAGFLLRHPPKQMKDFVGALDAMIRPTIAVTMIDAGEKTNVIPGSARLEFDCRLLPGQDWDVVEREIKKALDGKVEYKLEQMKKDSSVPGNASTTNSELFDLISETISKYVLGCKTIPFQLTGATDSRYFRNAFGSIAYGFMPMLMEKDFSEYGNQVHGRNERISISNLEFGTSVLLDVTTQFMTNL